MAIAVAGRLSDLKVQDAEASNAGDKRMIDELVASYPGGHGAMNRFVRNSIRDALLVIREHHTAMFERQMRALEQRSDSDMNLNIPVPRMPTRLLVTPSTPAQEDEEDDSPSPAGGSFSFPRMPDRSMESVSLSEDELSDSSGGDGSGDSSDVEAPLSHGFSRPWDPSHG
ncbi:unnamed protein product [Polarella glacialis]|uniref:Uncharacterized protein n=2 Tax=Polarella glacialis TaxID=89957 RepID=A0A813EEK6_POLGL|nr:unnamed protein product [Polarella glacialis]